MRTPLAALLILSATAAAASDLTLALPDGTPVQQVKASYTCPAGAQLTVAYITAGDSALAIVPVDGKPLIFANVLAASGARYAAGAYVWWTKGPDAALYDLRQGEGAPPVMTCQEKK
ncbi:MliC family protein [Azorhizobium doebereinerae]|uniref:MliC family protein n=1 Tax=Azorhizobium doebereinerae TaxID=281091 RepID=UPI0003F9EC44|nr:MliC family protein [Azorhizobium doebereinerae]